MNKTNEVKRKASIHWGSGDRKEEEKEFANDYLDANYKLADESSQ